MRRNLLYGIWAWMWIICGLLGHMEDPQGASAAVLVVIGLASFAPGALLLIDGIRKKHAKTVCAVRWISGLSLGLTCIAFVANILSVRASETVGLVLYEVLIFVSSPMLCLQFYPLSLFLWACLLVATFRKLIK